jgi:CubicO group peptidase (beta-lactamase class C family)
MDGIRIEGHCDDRFARVRETFAASFTRGEVGAAVAVVVDGELVVDLWGGFADAARTRPWERDTLVNVYSTTKGMTAVCAHRLVDEGRLDLDEPVAKYWPEFAQRGKQDVPVRMLLSHQAGLCAVDPPLTPERRYDWDHITAALAAQRPFWEPGTQHGYHAMTYGHLVGEVVRRIDGRSLGTYFREEVAGPLGADFHIGLGAEHDARCADMIAAPRDPRAASFVEMLGKDPESLAAKVFGGLSADAETANSRAWRAAEIPAGNGHGTARALARVYGALAGGGEIDGGRVLSAEGVERANTEQAFGEDAVLKPLHTRFGLGFMMTQPMIPFGPNPRAFGHPGAGGSIAFADPDTRLGFGYVMNQMQLGLAGGAHGFSLIAALYEAEGLKR